MIRDDSSMSPCHIGHLTVLVLLTFVCGCTSVSDTEPRIDSKQVTSIAIEHTVCYGKCPRYSVDFCADGKVQYDGKMFVERKGIRRGVVPPKKFEELAKFVLAHEFMGLKARYASDVTDQPSVITIVVAEGKSKSVEDYARAGPKDLIEIESRIDLLFTQVKWDDELDEASTHPSGTGLESSSH